MACHVTLFSSANFVVKGTFISSCLFEPRCCLISPNIRKPGVGEAQKTWVYIFIGIVAVNRSPAFYEPIPLS